MIDRLTSPGGLFLSAVLLAAAFPLTAPIRDPDFWWHLRSGQLILQSGGLLHTDPFTYTVSSHVWTMHEWLTEVLFAKLYAVGRPRRDRRGAQRGQLARRACASSPARGSTVPGPFALGGGIVLAVIAGYPIWGPRAQMLTFAFACLTLLLAERHLRRGGRLALLLLPMFLVWGNLHSGFLIGLGFIAVIVVAEAVAHLLHLEGRAPARRVRSLALLLVGSLLVCAINLNGPSIILYPFGTLGSAAQQSLILEWHSPDFHDWSVRIFGVMLLSLVALIVANRRIRLRDAALVLATVVLVPAVGAPHRAVRRRRDTGVDQPGGHAAGAPAAPAAPRAEAAAGGDARGQLGGAVRRAARRVRRQPAGAVDADARGLALLRAGLPGLRGALAGRRPAAAAHLQPVRRGRLPRLPALRARRPRLHLRRRRADG